MASMWENDAGGCCHSLAALTSGLPLPSLACHSQWCGWPTPTAVAPGSAPFRGWSGESLKQAGRQKLDLAPPGAGIHCGKGWVGHG